MSTQKRFLIWGVVGCVCICLSYMYASWAGYMSSNAPPPPSGILFDKIVLGKSQRDVVEALLRKEEGQLMQKGEFVGSGPKAEWIAGEAKGSVSALSFVAKSWTLRMFFDEKDIVIYKQLRW